MNRLWAPWRMAYIGNIEKTKDKDCIFCTKPAQSKDRENLILHRGNMCFIILNRYPYNNGHLMVVPNRHCSDPADLDGETMQEMWTLVRVGINVLKKVYHPEGFNIGMNLGRAAGAGIDQHIHMHIVPRWNGDTNFMPALGQVKVISQALEETWDQLKKNFP